MNLTVLSFFSHMLISHSPCFVSNQLSLNKNHFSKFSTNLLYNQQKLQLTKSMFSYGLGEVIYKGSDNEHVEITNHIFNNSQDYKDYIDKIRDASISIIDCSFIKINSVNTLCIHSANVSLYMTGNVFNQCSSRDSVVNLERCRCFTITHTCSYHSSAQYRAAFLFHNCVGNDFSINLYNTIVDSSQSATQDNFFNWYSQSGNQYHRCNNMTGMNGFNGYQFDDPSCISFVMNTVMRCSQNCIKISGNEVSNSKPKKIEMVNFFSNGCDSAILLTTSNLINLTVVNSALFSKSGKAINSQNPQGKYIVLLLDCIIYSQDLDYFIKTENCVRKSNYDTAYAREYPHYTYSNLCVGPNNNSNLNIHGCNAGNCLEDCPQTIGFPPGVPQYSTIIHTDIQSGTFTPTQIFSRSNQFTNSEPFTQSSGFTKSSDFSKSSQFTASMKFSPSSKFTKSSKFSNSNEFTKSNEFAKSNAFTKSSEFTGSNKFSKSKVFPKSDIFTSSDIFTKSNIFSSSDIFTKSDKFQSSNEFTSSESFSGSSFFTKSDEFSSSKKFTRSGPFTCTKSFSSSHHFSSSEQFTRSDYFTCSEMQHEQPGIDVQHESSDDNKKLIGIIAGSASGAAVIGGALAAFFLIKKKSVPVEDINTVEGNKESVVSVDNDLNNIMEQDDPFADEFV